VTDLEVAGSFSRYGRETIISLRHARKNICISRKGMARKKDGQKRQREKEEEDELKREGMVTPPVVRRL